MSYKIDGITYLTSDDFRKAFNISIILSFICIIILAIFSSKYVLILESIPIYMIYKYYKN